MNNLFESVLAESPDMCMFGHLRITKDSIIHPQNHFSIKIEDSFVRVDFNRAVMDCASIGALYEFICNLQMQVQRVRK